MKKYIYACIRLPMEIGDDGQCRPLNDRGKLFFEPCFELPPINTEPSPTLDDIMKSFHTSEIVFKEDISDDEDEDENTDDDEDENTDDDEDENTDDDEDENTDEENLNEEQDDKDENIDDDEDENLEQDDDDENIYEENHEQANPIKETPDETPRIFRYEITGSRAPRNGTNTYKRRHRLVHRYSVKKQYR